MAAIAAIIGTVVGAVGLTAVSFALKPVWNKINQLAFNVMPNELMPPVNLLDMRRRGIIDERAYYDEMKVQGYNQERSDLFYTNAETLLNGYEIVMLWRRGVIEVERRDMLLFELGYTHERIGFLLHVSAIVPGVRDVITFAVREVYSPEIAEAYGQYEGAQEVIDVAGEDIRAAGMTGETFKKYWASHWVLPSVGQGYEMMHRDIITPDGLQQLMVALDVMPYWRDKLIKMSHPPFTRVDVRRMHKIGVLTDEELIRSYRDLGYDEEKATALADFTILYNADPESAESTGEDEDRKREKEATRAAIMKAYKISVIEEGEAVSFLEEIGYTDEAINLFIANEKFQLEEDITSEKESTIHDGYVRRIYDHSQAVSKLAELNLPGRYIDALMDRWSIEKEAKTNKPAKAELFKLFKAKIITEQILREELETQGYTQKYVEWYVQLVNKSSGS